MQLLRRHDTESRFTATGMRLIVMSKLIGPSHKVPEVAILQTFTWFNNEQKRKQPLAADAKGLIGKLKLYYIILWYVLYTVFTNRADVA